MNAAVLRAAGEAAAKSRAVCVAARSVHTGHLAVSYFQAVVL